MPGPALVRPSAPPIAPPTVKGAVPLVVTVRDVPAPPSVTAPVPRFRARVPPNAKSPVHAWALLVASVTGDPLVLSIAPPAIVSVPVPIGELLAVPPLLTFSAPALTVVPPE